MSLLLTHRTCTMLTPTHRRANPGQAANGSNYVLDGDRALARGWVARARDNIAAIRLSKEIEAAGRAPTREEQAQLLRFVGFGATELAQNCFPLPGATRIPRRMGSDRS